jgi:hypothetical protein
MSEELIYKRHEIPLAEFRNSHFLAGRLTILSGSHIIMLRQGNVEKIRVVKNGCVSEYIDMHHHHYHHHHNIYWFRVCRIPYADMQIVVE